MKTYLFKTEKEAKSVLDYMKQIHNNYTYVTVEDLKNLIGFKPTYMDARTGWTSLEDASIKKIEEGYLLEIPGPDLTNIFEKRDN